MRRRSIDSTPGSEDSASARNAFAVEIAKGPLTFGG